MYVLYSLVIKTHEAVSGASPAGRRASQLLPPTSSFVMLVSTYTCTDLHISNLYPGRVGAMALRPQRHNLIGSVFDATNMIPSSLIHEQFFVDGALVLDPECRAPFPLFACSQSVESYGVCWCCSSNCSSNTIQRLHSTFLVVRCTVQQQNALGGSSVHNVTVLYLIDVVGEVACLGSCMNIFPCPSCFTGQAQDTIRGTLLVWSAEAS